MRQKKYDQAIKYSEEIREKFPKNQYGYAQASRVYRIKKNYVKKEHGELQKE